MERVLMVLALAVQAAPPRPAPMPPLPLTQLDERAPAGDLDKRAFTLTFAQPVPVQDLLLQVTDLPERLDRVAAYLDAVDTRVHRQVQVDARVIEIEPTDAKAHGVDWTAVAAKMSDAPTAESGVRTRPNMNGLRVTDVARLLAVLADQGTVTMIANPRLLTLNNEPAVIRSGTMSLSVTPQISGDSFVTLSLAPILASPAVFEADMVARIADGETLVLSGLTREREVTQKKAMGVSGGWFGRGTVVTRTRVELVILLTAKIVAGSAAQ